MSRRSSAAYYTQIERPISWCENRQKKCWTSGARYSKKDGQTLCPACRKEVRAAQVVSVKRRIKQNVWGNWNGYASTRRAVEFGTDERAAREWLETGKRPEFDPSIYRMKIGSPK